jgi:hypothetical protein
MSAEDYAEQLHENMLFLKTYITTFRNNKIDFNAKLTAVVTDPALADETEEVKQSLKEDSEEIVTTHEIIK